MNFVNLFAFIHLIQGAGTTATSARANVTCAKDRKSILRLNSCDFEQHENTNFFKPESFSSWSTIALLNVKALKLGW